MSLSAHSAALPVATTDLAGQLASRLRDLAGGEAVPHLRRLAGRLGVRSVTVAASLAGKEGRTVFRPAGPDVELSSTRRHEWRRVALAHELAHVLFRRHDLYLRETRVRLDVGGISEERLCDAVAAALLLPPGVADGRLRLERLLRAASSAQVPLPVVMRRLCALNPGIPPLLTIRRGAHGWCVIEVDGQGPGRPAVLCDEAGRSLQSLVHAPPDVVSIISLPVPGRGVVALEAAWAAPGALHALAASPRDEGDGPQAAVGGLAYLVPTRLRPPSGCPVPAGSSRWHDAASPPLEQEHP